ncbi:hypothetical protein BKA66DRAFT_405926 [Pyrenochaeta sp. MPI-SDFR-AT-0127]|nr:hypothetical protein BKA66DRAFT_405926 [Pyrenochaeta sp. MPI-SDFR-AT-0127]
MPEPHTTLLLSPSEIRYEMYAYLIPDRVHVHRRGDKLCLSRCIETLLVKEEDGSQAVVNTCSNAPDGYERQKGECPSPVWARRLRSAWGPHWDRNLEVVDLLARTAIIHITDLRMIRWLHEMMAIPLMHPRIVSSLALALTHLQMTLRLPLIFYQLLECQEDANDSKLELAGAIDTWLQLPATLIRMKQLSKFCIWLDHDEPCSWSVVNERALLAPITRLSGSRNLTISIVLPKLHPKLESDDRHFISGSPISFQLYRRLRQRWHAREPTPACSSGIVHGPDFPFLIDGGEEFALMPLADLEEEERTWWRDGTDVEELVRETNDRWCTISHI